MKDCCYDAVIYGAGASAAGAALRLLKSQRSVLLVTPNGFVGNEIATGLLTDLTRGFSPFADELIADLRRSGAYREYRTDPAIFELRLLEKLEKADILFYARPAGIIREGDRVKGMIVAAKDGVSAVRGRVFIDASDDLELLSFAEEKRKKAPASQETIFTFCMELDENLFQPDFTGEKEFSGSLSVWDTERIFRLRNAARTDLPAALTHIRETYEVYRDAMVTKASLAPVRLAVSTASGLSRFRNLFASEKKEAFTFAHHKDLFAVRMAEGERLADEAVETIPSCPPPQIRPAEICVESSPAETTCDVLVCGGGTAGAVAAIAAGRAGMSVTLWEGLDCLGGIGTGGAIPCYYYGLPGGLQDEIDVRAKACSALLCGRHAIDGKQAFRRFHPVAKMIVLEQMACEAGVKVEFGRLIYGVETSVCKPPQFPVPLSTPQPRMMNRLEAVEAATASGLVRCRAKTFIDATGDGDIAVFAGAKYTAGREVDAVQHIYSIPALFLNPVQDRDEHGAPVPGSGHFEIFPYNIDAGYVDACDPRDVSRARRAGLLGYSRDKFSKNGRILSFSTVVGARASRQIAGDVKLSLADQIRASEFPDVIAYSASHYDNHARDFENESLNALLWSWALDSHSEPIGCEIPYRAMLPLGIENLIIACRALSLDFDANLQFRMQRDMQRIGEAAGLAAAVAVRDGSDPRYIDVRKVQTGLAATSALLEPESNYHCALWKPADFYPDHRIFELTDNGFAPSRELLPGGVTGYLKLENGLKSTDPAVRYASALKLAAGAKLDQANAVLMECIRTRWDKFPASGWRNCSAAAPWKIAVAVCGANGCTDACKVIEDILTDEQCIGDQQALILAVRALGRIGNIHSARAIDTLLRRGDVAHTQEFSYTWFSDKILRDDSAWKLELAGFEAMYKLGLDKREYLDKYTDDPRGYVRRAAERVRLRTVGK